MVPSCDASPNTVTTTVSTSDGVIPGATPIADPWDWDGDGNWLSEQQSILSYVSKLVAPASQVTYTGSASSSSSFSSAALTITPTNNSPSATATISSATITCAPNSNPEGGDGLCTCQLGTQSTITTPAGGSYATCATVLPSGWTVPPPILAIATTTAPPAHAFSCNPNQNEEDSDGLCTCVFSGTKTLSPFTPVGGAVGFVCSIHRKYGGSSI